MKKILALSCAVVFLFGFTGYDWGDSSTATPKQEAKKPAPPPPTAPNADAMTALNNLLGSGTPAERQAKLDTLVRLSQILPSAAPQGVVATNASGKNTVAANSLQPTAQGTTTSTKKSSRRW